MGKTRQSNDFDIFFVELSGGNSITYGYSIRFDFDFDSMIACTWAPANPNPGKPRGAFQQSTKENGRFPFGKRPSIGVDWRMAYPIT